MSKGREAMKAAVLEQLGTIIVKEWPKPECDADSVLLRVRACAVCGSDIRIFHSGNNRVTTPQIIGHEIAGEVVEVGANVTKFKVGDRVAVGADVPCGECAFCEAGMGNNCQINYAMGYQFQGGFAEYLVLNKTVVSFGPVHKIPNHVTFNEAALAEPLGCVLNGLERCHIKLCDSVVIIGCGPIGCMMIPVAKKMGATKIICVEPSSERLAQAQTFGADVLINPSCEDAVARVLEETEGMGANVAITANPVPATQAQALQMARNQGCVNFFGGLAAGKSQVTLDTNLIHYKELSVVGTHGSLPRHHQEAVNLIASGAIDVDRFISHTLGLDDILKAFEISENKSGMRVVVNP